MVGSLAFSVAANAASWTWSHSYRIPGAGQGVGGLSCPTAKLCVSAGPVGNPDSGKATDDIFWSTNPSVKSSWHHQALELEIQPALSGGSAELIDGVSCEKAGTAIDCAAVDGYANLWQTSNPTGGAAHWGQSIPDNTGLIGLSCWSAWCGELDAYGHAVITIGATPQSDSDVFNISQGTSDGQESISCNASAFCGAVDMTHTIAWTTNATDQSPTWESAKLHGGENLAAIACPTARLCVTAQPPTFGSTSSTAWIGVSHNPASGGGSWKSVALPAADAGLYTIACESASLCVAGGSGFVLTSTHPSANRSAWHRSVVSLGASMLSCPTTKECFAASGQDGTFAVGRLG
jgi:hypothetical protein